MAKKNIRVVPKISNNLIAVYICIPSTGESRQVALVECPNDNQLNDNVELADELCKEQSKAFLNYVRTVPVFEKLYCITKVGICYGFRCRTAN